MDIASARKCLEVLLAGFRIGFRAAKVLWDILRVDIRVLKVQEAMGIYTL